MSGIRLLVGTRKGAFILTSDGKRKEWKVSGPHFAGWEIYHVKGSPADPNRIYASQTSGWFGQIIQRSDDGGKTWDTPGGAGRADHRPGRHAQRREQQICLRHFAGNRQTAHDPQWYDGTQHPWEFKRVWHLEPSLTDPDTVYAGVEDAALFRIDRRRQNVAGTRRIARPRHRAAVAARRGRNVSAHHSARSEKSEADFHRDFGGGRVSHR